MRVDVAYLGELVKELSDKVEKAYSAIKDLGHKMENDIRELSNGMKSDMKDLSNRMDRISEKSDARVDRMVYAVLSGMLALLIKGGLDSYWKDKREHGTKEH